MLRCNLENSRPIIVVNIPNVTTKSLQKENNTLKIATFRKSFDSFQQFVKTSEVQGANNGGHTFSVRWTQRHRPIWSSMANQYDSLIKFQEEARRKLIPLWSRHDELAAKVDEMSSTLYQFLRYSYQYNIKILGFPETDADESVSTTTALLLKSFKATGVEISCYDIDIAHRVPKRNATAGPRPIVCKFTRRIDKEKVMNKRNDACKVTATCVGIPADCSFKDVRLFDHLTPQIQQLLVDAKKFQNRNGCKFCWAKNFVVYLRQAEDSRPILFKSRADLENFAKRQGLPLS